MDISENTNRESNFGKGASVKAGQNEAKKRLQKELMDLMMANEKGISAFPEGDNLFRWIGTIHGPKDSVYDGLKFKLMLTFSSKYPFVAPNVNFITTCFHPNIDTEGNICLDILKDKWTALYDVRTVLLSIQSLLNEPNLDSPLDPSAANLWNKSATFKEVMLVKYHESNDGNQAKKHKS